jgi:hypothetical protein
MSSGARIRAGWLGINIHYSRSWCARLLQASACGPANVLIIEAPQPNVKKGAAFFLIMPPESIFAPAGRLA